MVIKLSEWLPKAEAWVRANGLDVDFFRKYPEHDVVHVVFGLSIEEEGIAVFLEERIMDNLPLVSEWEFEDWAFTLRLDTDTFSRERVREVYRAYEALYPVTFADENNS